ncbi:MAG TPA: ATP-binding cassette domain-containing protein [Thermoanaerobaculia bacterium]|nr:ATP-binding cassette domain-containing protein [Thermoanaerobaculia bacterium]
MSISVLTVENVTVRFGSKPVLSGVHGSARSGEVVGIVGANGAGKTTLARVIGGLLSPESGYVSLNDHRLSDTKPWGNGRASLVAWMFQSRHIAWNLTVRNNLISVTDLRDRRKRADPGHGTSRDDSIATLLAELGLIREEQTLAWRLSYGQQRLLALGRAILADAQILLLDEPFAGLSDENQFRVLDILKNNARQRIVLVIEHDLEMLRLLASKFWRVHDGQLTEHADFNSLLAGYKATGASRATCLSSTAGSIGTTRVTRPVPETSALRALRKSPRLGLYEFSAGYSSRCVVDKLNLEVFSGDILCILGANGSGKSTLLRAVMGLGPWRTGRVYADQQCIDGLPTDALSRLGLRMMPQAERVLPAFSIRDNLTLVNVGITNRNALCGVPFTGGAKSRELVRSSEDAFVASVGGGRRRTAGSLSSGEQTRLALMTFRFGPVAILLLDEPTAGLDGAARAELAAELRTLQRRRVGIVIAEHDGAFVATVATRAAELRDGQLHNVDLDHIRRPDLLQDNTR